MRNYQLLSHVYDPGWGHFAKHYRGLIIQLFEEYELETARILDLGCGTGSLAISLAKLGYTVYGLDKSPDMLKLARNKAAGTLNVSFQEGDMSNFHIAGQFDLVSCSFDAVNYLVRTRDLKAMLSCVSAVLRPSGLFVFDSVTPSHFLHQGRWVCYLEIKGQKISQEWSYNPVKRRSTTIFKFADERIETHHQRPYDLSELTPLMKGSGLRIVKALAGFDNRPYEDLSQRLICVAQRVPWARQLDAATT